MTTIGKMNQFILQCYRLYIKMIKKNINQPTIKKPPIIPSKPKSPLERGGSKYN